MLGKQMDYLMPELMLHHKSLGSYLVLFFTVFIVGRVVFTVASSCMQAHINSSFFYCPNISITHSMIENFLEV